MAPPAGYSPKPLTPHREANLRQRLLTDPHSPSEQRAAVVCNLDPWYPAFSVSPDDTLYLTPEQRVRIW